MNLESLANLEERASRMIRNFQKWTGEDDEKDKDKKSEKQKSKEQHMTPRESRRDKDSNR